MSHERNLILARLVAERARLLHILIGIDAHTLQTVPVFADWTAANLLVHIGDYDALFVERFTLVLEGKEAEIASISDDSTPDNPLAKRNAALQERIKTWDLERSVQYFHDSRSEFSKLLAQVSDKDLKRKRDVSWGETTLYDWTCWRWRHDAGHAEDLRRWRKTLPQSAMTGDKNLMLDTLRAAREDFRASMALIPKNQHETRLVCGTWTLKDVCGHMADWDVYFNRQVRLMMGLGAQELKWDADADGINDLLVTARREQSLATVIYDFGNAFEALMNTLVNADEDDINYPYSDNDSPYPTAYHCAWAALEHYLDHAAVMRKELPVKVPKHLKLFAGLYA